jgi:hypothetical protein
VALCAGPVPDSRATVTGTGTGTGRRAVPEFTVIPVARVRVLVVDAAARAVITVHSDLPVADSEPAVVGTRKY